MRRHRAEQPLHVFANGLMFDATADGRWLMFLNMLDEHSRLCLALRVGSRCKADEVVTVLEELTSLYQAPAFIRPDNGPILILQARRDWFETSTTTSWAYIAPRSMWEKGSDESYELRATTSTTPYAAMNSSILSCSLHPWLHRSCPTVGA